MSKKTISRRQLLAGIGTGIGSIAAGSVITGAASGSGVKGGNIQRWVDAGQAVSGGDVDVGFSTHHPKEPSVAHYNGSWYMAVAVWDKYLPSNVTEKQTVVLKSDTFTGPYTQISQVTSASGVNHAPAIWIDSSGELWVFYSRDGTAGDGANNDIIARHQTIGSIGSSPSDWVGEGTIIGSARDAAVVADGDTYHLTFTNEANSGTVGRATSTDLISWTAQDSNIYDLADNQAPELVPIADGSGYWICTTAMAYESSNGGHDILFEVAGQASSLTANKFRGKSIVTRIGNLNGIVEPWFEDWTSHFTWARGTDGGLMRDGNQNTIAFFEGGDGDYHSVGWAISDYAGDDY